MDEEGLNLEAILGSDHIIDDKNSDTLHSLSMSLNTPSIQTRAGRASISSQEGRSETPLGFGEAKDNPVKDEIQEAVYSFSSSPPSITRESISPHEPIVSGVSRTSVPVRSPPDILEPRTQQAELSSRDDDDDIIIIKPAVASSAAQRKWAKLGGRFRPIIIGTSDSAVKQEPHSPKCQVEATLPSHSPCPNQPNNQSKKSTVIDFLTRNREFVEKKLMASRESNGPRFDRKRRRLEIDGRHVPDDPEQIDEALRDPSDEDHSWMEAEPEQDNEYNEKKQLRDELEIRLRNGKITSTQKAKLFRLRKQLNEMNLFRNLAARAETSVQDEEESLFVSEDVPPHVRYRSFQQRSSELGTLPETERHESRGLESSQGEGFSQDLDLEDMAFAAMLKQAIGDDIADTNPIEKEIASTSKPRKKRAKNAREVREQEREKELKKAQKQRETERTKAQRKKAPGGKPSAPQGRGKKDTSTKKKPAAKPKSKAKHDGYVGISTYGQGSARDEIAQRILEDLIKNDPIADRVRNPIFETDAEPQMEGRNKQTQLQRLFANIPDGSSENTARCDKKKLQEASKSFGYAKVKAVDGKWLVKGMKSTLYHHQLLGAQWMVSRELSDTAPYGGLLADSMGLGKTVQTLACMVGNPPSPDDHKRGLHATLIVVPSSVIGQWMTEIRAHAEETTFPKILHYSSKSKIMPSILQSCDIVVTSYNQVMRQFPFPDAKSRKEIAQMGYKRWWKTAKKQIGVLHRVSWYRVVLDEAHAIKNNTGRTSLACQNLKSIFRWCLSGTPILNRLEELFPYLRFLKADYSMDWKTFQNYFCDPEADDCHVRIATLLSFTMIRRTMSTTILNRPIIQLPTPHPSIQYVDFSAEERIIYRITENRFRSNLNLFLKNKSQNGQNDIQSNYGTFLVQLLRLRQCTSHPFMLECTIKEAWTSADLKELKHKFSQLKNNTRPFYEKCRVWVNESVQAKSVVNASVADSESQPSGVENNEVVTKILADQEGGVPMRFGSSTYGHKFNMKKAFKTLNEKKLWSRETCRLCSDLPDRPQSTDCGHVFCHDCITTYIHEQSANDAEYEDSTFTCPACDKMFYNLKPYKGAYEGDDDDESSPEVSVGGEQSSRQSSVRNGYSAQSKKKIGKNNDSKGRDAMGFEPSTKHSTWVHQSDTDPEFPLTASAKTVALKAILLKGFTEAPTDKVVIYVQFRTLAKIVGRICASENWGFLYLTGDTSLDHRAKAVEMFRVNPEIKILIAGLKCGGLGLNFPWANRCISLDLWWNNLVEQQAFGRIFRIGQKKETYMTRICTRNSVDMRLLSMQMWKLKTCERAMQDGNKKDNVALNLADLARLFGFLRTDEDGEPIEVVADYDDEPQSQDNGEGTSSSAKFFGADTHASSSSFSGDEIDGGEAGEAGEAAEAAEAAEGGYMDDLNNP